MDYKYKTSSKRSKKDQNSNDNQIVPKMILKHSTKDNNLHQSVSNSTNQQIRLLSPHPNQNSTQKTYDQNYSNSLLGIDVKEKLLPDIFNLIDNETWTFKDNSLIKFLNSDQPTNTINSNSLTYSKIGIVGKQGVGKSNLANKLAGRNVFRTHLQNGNEFLLKHITEGIDLHITSEFLMILDSQPLMSASILDDLIKNSHINNHVPQELVEPEKFVYITSLQILSFLIANCDYVIIMNEWLMDLHFLKLISTALMLIGDDVNPKADLIFYFKKRFTSITNSTTDSTFKQTLQSIFGKSIIIYEDDNEDDCNNSRFVSNMLKLCAKKKLLYSNLNNNQLNLLEKNWLINSKRYWENITSKSSLYVEYSRFIF